MNSKIKASLVAGGLALAGFVSSANAAVISYSEDFSFGSTTINDTTNNGSAVSNSQSQTFNLSGFDSSLGTLTGVSIYFDTDWELTSRLVAKDPGLAFGSYGEGTASSEMKVSLTNPTGSDNSTIESLVSSCVSFKAFNARCRDTESVNGDFNDTIAAINNSI